LAGEVWDRLNGRGLNGAIVRAVGTDSLVHVARADQDGVFAFRYLPAGDFVLTGFQDSDRDRDMGARESRGTAFASLAAGDTLVVDIPVLAPDSTSAVPGVATALDSVTLVVEFDDYLDPESPTDGIDVQLSREGGDAPVVERLFHEAAYQRYVDQIADSFARLDSVEAAARAQAAAARAAAAVAADSLVDSLGTAPASPDSSVAAPQIPASVDTVGARPGAEPRPLPPRMTGASGPQAPAVAGRARPSRRIVGLLDRPLEAGVEYQVRVRAVVNINDLPDGGGEVVVRFEPPPPDTASVGPDADATDSTAVPEPSVAPDSLGVQP
jgi:hypothetical protein